MADTTSPADMTDITDVIKASATDLLPIRSA
jgi:hypothetical protein